MGSASCLPPPRPAMAPSERRGWWMKLKIASAGVGVVMGLLVFIIFTFVYGNVSAGVWAALSSTLAGLVLHQHVLFSKAILASVYTPGRFKFLLITGAVLLCLSLAVTIYYLTMKIRLSQGTYPIRESYLIAAVWSFMTSKWSFFLSLYSHKYKVKMDGEREYSTF